MFRRQIYFVWLENAVVRSFRRNEDVDQLIRDHDGLWRLQLIGILIQMQVDGWTDHVNRNNYEG
jgi:hypothetical protein